MSALRALTRIGSGVAAAGLAGAGVLAAQVIVAAQRRYLEPDTAPPTDGSYGDPGRTGLRLVLLGDSTAAGVGAGRTDETVGGLLASLLAAEGRRVELVDLAVSGSRTRDLGPQVSRALLARPDIAVLLIGANDATRLSNLAQVRADLAAALDRLRMAGVASVVGTCPDLGAARALDQPLRALAGWQGRRVAAAQRAAARSVGVATVDLAGLTGPTFRRDPNHLAADEFHPSAQGYRLWAAALLPTVRELAGVRLPS